MTVEMGFAECNGVLKAKCPGLTDQAFRESRNQSHVKKSDFHLLVTCSDGMGEAIQIVYAGCFMLFSCHIKYDFLRTME